MSKIVLAKLEDEDEDDKILRDGRSMRVPMMMMDADSIEAKKEAAYQKMVARQANAWKSEPVALTPAQKPISGVENYVTTGKGREGYIENLGNAWKR